jgi:hypothetical protein
VANIARGEKQGQEQWWWVERLIAGLDATPTQKYLLTLIHLHSNSRKGFAWASQETLAHELCTDPSTVKRVFRWGKQLGVIGVRRVRTGKGKDDQYNEYWLEPERLKELQRPPKQGASTPLAEDEHSASTPLAPIRARGKSDSSKGQISMEQGANREEARGTSDLVGFEVKQVASNSGRDNIRGSSLRSPDPGVSPEIESQIQELVRSTISLLRSYDMRIEKPRLDIQFDFFRKEANSLGVSWTEIQKLWKQVLETVFPPEPAPQPQARQPEPEPEESKIDPNAAETLRRHARERGMNAAQLRNYIWRNFRVPSARHLSIEQYHAAMDAIVRVPKLQ